MGLGGSDAAFEWLDRAAECRGLDMLHSPANRSGTASASQERRGPGAHTTISFQCFAGTNWGRCLGFVVTTVTSAGAGPKESA